MINFRRIFNSLKVSYSYRRAFIDRDLNKIKPQLKDSAVLDLGGKKQKKRGEFEPPIDKVQKWIYLNLDFGTRPDILGDGEALPLKGSAFDWVVCSEVLEFIKNPDFLISEISRVLKKSGRIALTSPFLYRLHEQPRDLQRFTDIKLKQLLISHGFQVLELNTHGSYFTVIADQIMSACAQIPARWLRILIAIPILPLLHLMKLVDSFSWVAKSDFFSSFTTGYFIVAQKISYE